jgi:hypothetical protein
MHLESGMGHMDVKQLDGPSGFGLMDYLTQNQQTGDTGLWWLGTCM